MSFIAEAQKPEGAPGISSGISPRRTARSVSVALIVGLTLAVFWVPLRMLFWFSLQEEQYSHILLVPVVSAFLFLRDRRTIFANVGAAWQAGPGMLVAGFLLNWLGRKYFVSSSENDQLFIMIFSVVVIWVGGFTLCYGLRAFRAALFPLLFLFLIAPIPDLLLNRVIVWLQHGSAEVSYAVFQLVGVPVFRTGFVFALPGVTIEIARECSGIRSSLALLITSLLAGHLFLRSAWTKAVFTLATIPLLIVKNGIRIVTLSLLSIYIDPSFLTGSLHHQGGVLFFLLALVILTLLLRLLQKPERRRRSIWGTATS
jgi:exosortase